MKDKGTISSKNERVVSHRAINYVNNLTKGMTKKDAALDAGYSESTALNAKTAIESQSAVQKLMIEAGITHESLVQKLREGMEATKLSGKDSIEHPDFKTRHQYMTTGFRMLGVETEKPAAQINAQINIGSASEVQQINEAFTQFLGKFFGTRKEPQNGEE